ncbi:unnamed protein product [Heterobilharzia americana]|nr:unnamed protein product [Heterobilharzia americana]
MSSSNKEVFDPWNTYYESPEEQAAIKERARRREVMKAEFRKQFTSPFRQTFFNVFDPAVQRQFSAQVTYAEYIQPSPRLGLLAAGFFGFTAVIMILRNFSRTSRRSKFESGQLTYAERWGKAHWW